MDSEKVPLRPKHLDGAPPWDELQRELISWCERTRSALEAELGRHPKGNHNREIVSGAIEYCAEVIPVLERAPNWEAANAANGDLSSSVPLWAKQSTRLPALRPLDHEHACHRRHIDWTGS